MHRLDVVDLRIAEFVGPGAGLALPEEEPPGGILIEPFAETFFTLLRLETAEMEKRTAFSIASLSAG